MKVSELHYTVYISTFRDPAATQRHLQAEEETNRSQNSDASLQSERAIQSMSESDHQSRLEVPKKSYQVHAIGSHQNRKRLRACAMHNILGMSI